jgi:hypothetical protein
VSIRMVIGCLIWLAAATASAQAPIPVVERVFTDGDVATRVTLFSNQVIVVSITENGKQGFLQHMTLPADQYLIYLGILQKAAEQLGEQPVTSSISTPNAEIVLTLHVGPKSPRVIRYSPLATVSLELALISGAINDLESLVRQESPSHEELRGWVPRRGDRVELMTGGSARVDEVLDGGVLVIEHEGTYIREIVGPEARDEVIRRVVERGK